MTDSTWTEIIDMSHTIEAMIAEARYEEAGALAKTQYEHLQVFFSADSEPEASPEEMAAGIEQIQVTNRSLMSRIESNRSKLDHDVSRAREGARAMKRYTEAR